jgi:L-iditol 2-dehydrogenase
MKALLLREYRKLEVVDAPVPEAGADEVLVGVRACAICGSDVHGYDGSTGRRIPPVIMGHEAAGVIAEVGRNVTGFRPGERITFDSTVYCGTCGFCRAGHVNLCDNRRVLGVSCPDYRRDGAFAEYVVVPPHILYRIPDELSFDHAAMIEPLSIAFHAVRRTPVTLGDTALVVGSGVIGLLLIQALRLAGCGRVIAVDVDENRLALARRLGADETLNPACTASGNPAEAVMRLTDGRGADSSFEAVGKSETLQLAVAGVRKGGSVTLVGNISPKAELALQLAVTRELTLIGSCASAGEYPACIRMLADRRVDVASLISAAAPLEEGPSWFDRLYAREPGLIKVVLRPQGKP